MDEWGAQYLCRDSFSFWTIVQSLFFFLRFSAPSAPRRLSSRVRRDDWRAFVTFVTRYSCQMPSPFSAKTRLNHRLLPNHAQFVRDSSTNHWSNQSIHNRHANFHVNATAVTATLLFAWPFSSPGDFVLSWCRCLGCQISWVTLRTLNDFRYLDRIAFN